ncbi:hypothetical protein D3C75_838860 [compost metagenome]
MYGAESEESFSAAFTLYEDDGHSFGYRKGEYSQITVQAEGTGDGLLLNWSYTTDAYKPVREMLRFALCYPFFVADAVDGLPEISLEELKDGRRGWARNGKSGAIIIQTPDERSDGELRIRAAE